MHLPFVFRISSFIPLCRPSCLRALVVSSPAGGIFRFIRKIGKRLPFGALSCRNLYPDGASRRGEAPTTARRREAPPSPSRLAVRLVPSALTTLGIRCDKALACSKPHETKAGDGEPMRGTLAR